VFGDIRELLDQQFHRLSALEKQVDCLASYRVCEIAKAGRVYCPNSLLWRIHRSVESLHQRSLIERHSDSFTQPVIMDYMTGATFKLRSAGE